MNTRHLWGTLIMELNQNFTMLLLSRIILSDKVISSTAGQGDNASAGPGKGEKWLFRCSIHHSDREMVHESQERPIFDHCWLHNPHKTVPPKKDVSIVLWVSSSVSPLSPLSLIAVTNSFTDWLEVAKAGKMFEAQRIKDTAEEQREPLPNWFPQHRQRMLIPNLCTPVKYNTFYSGTENEHWINWKWYKGS